MGIAGVAPSARALIVKVLASDGSGYDSDVAAGIQWATDHGARVINLSIGSDVPLTGDFGSIPSAIDYAYQHGVAVAVAAGNNDLPLTDYQVSQIARESLVVGALGRTGQVAYYSTNGVGVNIYAPGGDDLDGTDTHGLVVSTHTGKSGYAVGEGTSFAAPQAAGVLALLMSRGMTNVQARQRVLDTAADRNGVPQLDAAAAVGSTAMCPSNTVPHVAASAPPVETLSPPARSTSHSNASTSVSPKPSVISTTKNGTTTSSSSAVTPLPTTSLRAAGPIAHSPAGHPWALVVAAIGVIACAAALGVASFVRR
jgi:subtilisin family serine protease